MVPYVVLNWTRASVWKEKKVRNLIAPQTEGRNNIFGTEAGLADAQSIPWQAKEKVLSSRPSITALMYVKPLILCAQRDIGRVSTLTMCVCVCGGIRQYPIYAFVVCTEKSFFVLCCATNFEEFSCVYLFTLFSATYSGFVFVDTFIILSQEFCYQWHQLQYLLAYWIKGTVYINTWRHLVVR
jgi:hypothetical protein